jgi:hypothetical protein
MLIRLLRGYFAYKLSLAPQYDSPFPSECLQVSVKKTKRNSRLLFELQIAASVVVVIAVNVI